MTINWDGTNWNNVTTPGTPYLTSVHIVSANDGWAVGYPGAILHWNGTEWNTITSPTSTLLWSVYMVDASDGWAVGDNGTILRWTGTGWIPEFPTVILMPFLLVLTLGVTFVLSKKASKKPSPCINALPSKTSP